MCVCLTKLKTGTLIHAGAVLGFPPLQALGEHSRTNSPHRWHTPMPQAVVVTAASSWAWGVQDPEWSDRAFCGPNPLCEWWVCRDWSTQVPAKGTRLHLVLPCRNTHLAFAREGRHFFLNPKISSSVKYTCKCVCACHLAVSCNMLKCGLWAVRRRLPSSGLQHNGYVPWRSGIIILC